MVIGSLLTAMVTPFNDRLEVDYEQAKKIAHHLVEHGNDGIVVAGTTGESPNLTLEEKLKLFQIVKETVGEDIAVIAGTGSNSTLESVELTVKASKLGIDGVMLVTPYYNKPSQEGLFSHFETIAKSTALPVILYNVPSRTGCNLLPETVARLAELDNIAAIKEASGSLDQVSLIRASTPSDFAIYSGDDALTLPILAIGGCGVISVAGHIVGRDIKTMIEFYKNGNVSEARAIHTKLYPLYKALFITTNPVPIKYVMERIGLSAGGVRLPLVTATMQEQHMLDEILKNLLIA